MEGFILFLVIVVFFLYAIGSVLVPIIVAAKWQLLFTLLGWVQKEFFPPPPPPPPSREELAAAELAAIAEIAERKRGEALTIPRERWAKLDYSELKYDPEWLALMKNPTRWLNEIDLHKINHKKWLAQEYFDGGTRALLQVMVWTVVCSIVTAWLIEWMK